MNNTLEVNEQLDFNENFEQIEKLLKYAPNNFIKKVIDKLEEYKKLDNLDF